MAFCGVGFACHNLGTGDTVLLAIHWWSPEMLPTHLKDMAALTTKNDLV